MNFIQKIFENYRQKKLSRKEIKEKLYRIESLNKILNQKLPTKNIIQCENYLKEVEYFLMEMSPYALKDLLAAGLETDCKFVQLTGKDAGEEFHIPKPCFLSQQKDSIPAYFLLNNNGNLSVAVNSYGNYDIETDKGMYNLEKLFGRTVSLCQIIRLRDRENGYKDGDSINLEDEGFVWRLNRLDECAKMLRKENYEISSRKS